MYGNPDVNTFMIWGWWDGATSSMDSTSVLVNTDWKTSGGAWDLTAVGQTFVNDMTAWTTPTQTIDANSSGQISFNGYYGDYYLSGQPMGTEDAEVMPYDLAFNQGSSSLSSSVAEPANWFFWKVNGSGTWNTGGNWTDATQGGAVPNTAGYTAYFGSSATVYSLSSGAATTTNINAASITVTLSGPVTMGMLVFDTAASSYTLTGSSISLQGYANSNGNVAAIYVNNGSHAINTPISLLSNTTVTVAPSASTLTVANLSSTSATLTKAGLGNLKLTGTTSLSGGATVAAGQMTLSSGSLTTPQLTANSGGSVAFNGGTLSPTSLNLSGGQMTLASSVTPVMVLTSLAFAGSNNSWSGKLDLNNNDMIVQGAGAAGFAAITNQIGQGYNGGSWTGNGITSSAAAATTNTGLGVELNMINGGSALFTSFDGQPVTTADVLVKYTYLGDADLNGVVNGSDYTLIDNGLNNGLTGWRNGDFNYDGVVNGDDYTLIDNSFNTQAGPLSEAALATEMIAHATAQIASGDSQVPEPGGLMMLAAAGLLSRRRIRSNRTMAITPPA